MANLDKSMTVDGVRVPTFVYGTAWKEDRTEELVRSALAAGFTGIDTANQRRHYYEEGVGKGIAQAVPRDQLFLQTKFTYAPGQDHRLPYDPNAAYATQVQQSFESSLEHLGTTYLDSYVLHGPSSGGSLTDIDWEVWKAMETIHQEGKAKLLGVSNVHFMQLVALYEGAEVKPRFVQNRCFARNRWDAQVREFCRKNDILYQGFSLLTANQHELLVAPMAKLSERLNRGIPEIVFRFAQHVGMIPLTGTTDPAHMKQDLTCYDFELDAGDIEMIETIAG